MYPIHPSQYLTSGTKGTVPDANTITNGPRTGRTTANALVHTVLANLRKWRTKNEIYHNGWGDYGDFPKQMLKVMGERIVERTIRLLQAYGVKDIAVSATHPLFNILEVPVLKHENNFVYGKNNHSWLQAFYR